MRWLGLLNIVALASAAPNDNNKFLPVDSYGSARHVGDEYVLSPPSQASQAGAVWAKQANDLESDWTLTVKYRVNGPEHGGKGMAIWYTSDRGQGGPVLGGMDKWDGLGLFLTAQPDGTGALRGHLNDRSVAFARLDDSKNSHFGVDHEALHQSDAEKQAFAACTVQYRNLGVISEITVSYNTHSLKVTHDGEVCFENEHVTLPKGYYFGVSALSTEQADSHELHGLQVKSGSHTPTKQPTSEAATRSGRNFGQTDGHGAVKGPGKSTTVDTTVGDLLTQVIKDVAETRQQVNKLANLQGSVEKLEQAVGRMGSAAGVASHGGGGDSSQAVLNSNHELANKLDDVARQVRALEAKFATMEHHIEVQTQRIVEALPPPAHDAIKLAVYVILFAQAVCLGSYVLYRRRIDNKSKVW